MNIGDHNETIDHLIQAGHTVERVEFPPLPWPGLYRVNDGPELTEAQLVDFAQREDQTDADA